MTEQPEVQLFVMLRGESPTWEDINELPIPGGDSIAPARTNDTWAGVAFSGAANSGADDVGDITWTTGQYAGGGLDDDYGQYRLITFTEAGLYSVMLSFEIGSLPEPPDTSYAFTAISSDVTVSNSNINQWGMGVFVGEGDVLLHSVSTSAVILADESDTYVCRLTSFIGGLLEDATAFLTITRIG